MKFMTFIDWAGCFVTYPFMKMRADKFKNKVADIASEIEMYFNIDWEADVSINFLPGNPNYITYDESNIGQFRTKGVTSVIYPFRINIFIWPGTTLESCMKTVFHELTHLEQLQQGRLQKPFAYSDSLIWEGKNFKHLSPEFGNTTLEYMSTPWEMEADTKSERIYRTIFGK